MFADIRKLVQDQFDIILQTGNLFQVAVDRDKIWEIYIQAFDPQYRQENTCNCCKSFLRQFGGIVGLADHKVVTLWDFECHDPEYAKPIKALKDYILSLPVTDIYRNSFAKCGTKENVDSKRNIIWKHFYIELPKKYVMRDVESFLGKARDDKNVLHRSLREITDEAVNITLELMNQGALYRGNEFKPMVTAFKEAKDKYNAVPKSLQSNFCWEAAAGNASAVSRIRNTAIGTLLVNLSEGMDIEAAGRAFERVVAPANYKRPTALVTPRMVNEAKERIEELGMLGSLNRRLLSDTDLTVNNALFVKRISPMDAGDVFAEVAKGATINPRSLGKVDEVSIDSFITNILPTAKSVKLLLENEHLGNFVSMVGPADPATPTMFKWGNSFSWSYTGQVADSIKERVKQAGGAVEGALRVSLSWHNFDDLDLHIHEPGNTKIYYGNKNTVSPTGGKLDVDMNAGCGTTREPVENVIWLNPPRFNGRYKVIVNQFSKRETSDTGFTVEIEYNGEIYEFHHKNNGTTGSNFTVAEFDYDSRTGFKLLQTAPVSAGKSYNSKEKWGLKTGQFHAVRAITLSPNHWDTSVGNKHFFFILEGCKTDEVTRPFYNEFLKSELDKDRKVFEILGSKIVVAPSENQLSGLGFSDTVRAHAYVEVEGAFKRTLKINF